jgi:hypothetical protein
VARRQLPARGHEPGPKDAIGEHAIEGGGDGGLVARVGEDRSVPEDLAQEGARATTRDAPSRRPEGWKSEALVLGEKTAASAAA